MSAKTKNRVSAAALLLEPFEQQPVLVIEHGEQPLPADVTLGLAVNRVADLHVVGGDGLGDGARGAAHAEKPARHLLAGADLGERAVFRRVEIDPQRLLMGPDAFLRGPTISGFMPGRVSGSARPPTSEN